MEDKISIGIVEDHLLFRKSVVTFLNSTSTCRVAFELSNGKGVVESIRMHAPNILLLDLQMPEVDGFTALKEIRKHLPSQKVIIYSSLFTREHGISIFKNQIQNYLPKQVSLNELIQAIEELNEV